MFKKISTFSFCITLMFVLSGCNLFNETENNPVTNQAAELAGTWQLIEIGDSPVYNGNSWESYQLVYQFSGGIGIFNAMGTYQGNNFSFTLSGDTISLYSSLEEGLYDTNYTYSIDGETMYWRVNSQEIVQFRKYYGAFEATPSSSSSSSSSSSVITSSSSAASSTTIYNEPIEATVTMSWQNSGVAGWTVDTTTGYLNNNSMKSGSILNSQFTTLTGTFTGNSISFYWKVSSESGYDFLSYSIDGIFQEKISGEVNWTLKTKSLTQGEHTITFEYRKDSSIERGSDCGWVDNMVISSGAAASSGRNKTENNNSFTELQKARTTKMIELLNRL